MRSSFSLSEKHPPAVVSPTGLWGLLDVQPAPNEVSCPRCSGTSSVRPAPEGGFWVACQNPKCRWSGDNFEYFLARTGIEDIQAGLELVRRREVPVLPGSDNPAVVRSYQKQLRARKGFRLLTEAMFSVKDAPAGAAHTACGLHSPVVEPYWGTVPVAMLDGFLEDAYPNRTEDRRLGLSSRYDLGESALCLPAYDELGRVTGIWASARTIPGRLSPDWRWRGVHGLPAGVALLHSSTANVSSWGGCGIVCDDPGEGVRLHNDLLRHRLPHPPVVVNPPVEYSEPPRISSILPNRDWVVLCQKSINEAASRSFRLAECLGARIRLMPEDRDRLAWTAPWASQELVSRAGSWEDRLGELIEHTPPGDRLGAFLGRLGWGERLAGKVRGRWPASTVDKAGNSVYPSMRGLRVMIRKDMTIVETPKGWLWDERGLLVARAFPTSVVAYKAADGVRHKGVIMFKGDAYPFDSLEFRKNPGAVMETTLLDAGVQSPPTFHPSIAGLEFGIAMQFNNQNQ